MTTATLESAVLADAAQGRAAMSNEEYPVFHRLDSVYDGTEEQAKRYKDLQDAFKKAFGEASELFARAPGRVNVIGEHIDYEGYGVLPMAIKQDTVVAIRRGGTKLVISSPQPDKYPTVEFDTDPNQEVDTKHHSWANYFMCAYKGVYELLEAKGLKAPEPTGLQIMIHGTVPTGAGVSSSAALVCSSSLAILGIHGISISKADVADFAAKAERYVGVTSGGMDQAISMMGMPGVAKLIDFNPVRAVDVVLPEGAVFVVANSLAVSNKAEGAHKRYNLRVLECRLAAALLALGLGVDRGQATTLKTLREVEPLVADKYLGSLEEKLVKAVEEHLHDGMYSHDEVEGLLGVSLPSLYQGSAVSLKVIEGARESGGFKLRARALHVYQEAFRVRRFKAVCDEEGSADSKLAKLGELMDASHASCSRLYECSCPELDELVGVAKAAGAIGSRLTGAGWGGCTVSLVRDAELEDFLTALRTNYYADRIKNGVVTAEQLPDALFASKPAAGASVLKLAAL